MKHKLATKTYLLTLAMLSYGAWGQTRDLFVVHKNLTDQAKWFCANSSVDTRQQGAELLKQYKSFLLSSNETFDFGQSTSKAGEKIIANKGNSWAKEFKFRDASTEVLEAVGSWEPQKYAEDDTIDAKNVMHLSKVSGSTSAITANLIERLTVKATGKTESTLVSTLYCYSEQALQRAFTNLGVNNEKFEAGKKLRGDREYLDGRPDTEDKQREVLEFTAERDSWLNH